VPSLTVHYG